MSSWRDRKDITEKIDNDPEFTNSEKKFLKVINSSWFIWIITLIFATGGYIMTQRLQTQYTDKRVDKVESQQYIFAEKIERLTGSMDRIDERTKMILERLK